jgi:Tol biopolymer transport system component
MGEVYCARDTRLDRTVRTRLTFGPVSNTFPAWSPDGHWIAYTSTESGSPEV